MQYLFDSATDMTEEGTTKVGIGRDGNGMNHSRFDVVKVERIENAKVFAYNAFRSNLPRLAGPGRLAVHTDALEPGCRLLSDAALDSS